MLLLWKVLPQNYDHICLKRSEPSVFRYQVHLISEKLISLPLSGVKVEHIYEEVCFLMSL